MSEAPQDRATTAHGLHLHQNRTAALGLHHNDMDQAVDDLKVYNIVIIAVALCILTITALYCISACYSRSRQSKRAHVYESAVTRGEPVDPVAVRAVKGSTSSLNPLTFFRRPEAAKDNSRIYYIYSNPLPVGLKEEEEEEEQRMKVRERSEDNGVMSLPLLIQEYASDPKSGIVLDPPMFYMQL